VPAYAPQLTGKEALDDATIEFYWAVVPLSRTVKSSVSLARGLAAGAGDVLDTSTPTPPINGVNEQPANLPLIAGRRGPNYALQATQDPTTPVSSSAIESSVSMRRPGPRTSMSLGPQTTGRSSGVLLPWTTGPASDRSRKGASARSDQPSAAPS
jgi:hypothetical protein